MLTQLEIPSREQLETIVELVEETPFYLIIEDVARKRCREVKSAFKYEPFQPRYAAKSLTIGAFLQIIKDEGFFLDLVSKGEAFRGRTAGFKPEEMLYTGEDSSPATLQYLLDYGFPTNFSSLDQAKAYFELAKRDDLIDVPLSIRINPGFGEGHDKGCNTGGPDSKHGEYPDMIPEFIKLMEFYQAPITRLHCHIGSGGAGEEWGRVANDFILGVGYDFARQLEEKGWMLDTIDIGGGFPIQYDPADTDFKFNLDEMAGVITGAMEQLSEKLESKIALEVEPGRYPSSDCAMLVTKAWATKSTPDNNFMIVDASTFNHNPRPVLYGSYHHADVLADGEEKPFSIGGNNCESGDVFTRQKSGELMPRMLPTPGRGDLVVMHNMGAYSIMMSSNYNSGLRAPVYMLRSSGELNMVRGPDQELDLIRHESLLEDL